MIEVGWHVPPQVVEDALARLLPAGPAAAAGPAASGSRLREAVRHAVFGGGKRLRSQLVLEAGYVSAGAGFEMRRALPAACAVELIHAYSLVHDDLPAMDDAALRRGRPSCHKAYGEAMAILAGDALLTLAFETLAGGLDDVEDAPGNGADAASDSGRAVAVLRATRLLARAAGEAGMVGGQAADIYWSSTPAARVSGEQLLAMHARKTGALIAGACEAGALLAGGAPSRVAALREYGEQLGRAFQIHDDVLDVEGDPELTGKQATDEANYKTTAPAIFGLPRSKQMALEAAELAVAVLAECGPEAAALRRLAEFVVRRDA